MSPSAQSRAFVALRGVIYAAGFILLWVWLAALAQRFDSRLPFSLPDWLRAPGMLLALAGALVTAACIATFLTRGQGTPAPFDPPRQFVATGPYRYVRNPMYVGAFGVLVGAGLAMRSPSILGLAVVFLLIMHLFVVLYEEQALAGRFGDAYLEYKSVVHRWLPRLPRRSRR